MKRLAALLLLLATCAHAGNGVSSITVQKWRSLTSVAIKAIVSGDDDSSAVLRIFQKWRGRGNNYDTGMVMVRRIGTNIHEGRILWMSPGATVDFFIEAQDAGGNGRTAEDTVSCAVVRPIVATGPVYYVNQATGSDGNPGTLASPFLTIDAARVALANSTNSGANGGIIVAPGEYHERLDLNFGTDGYHRFLMGDGTNVDSTIICGASAVAEQGKHNDTNSFTWVVRPKAGVDIDSVYYITRAAASSFIDSTTNITLGWGETLHKKTSLAELMNCAMGEYSGWFYASDTLYVRRKNGQSPTGTTLHAGYRDILAKVDKRNWHISRLTFRFAGGKDNQGYGIVNTAGGHNSSGLVVDSCRFYGLNAPAVYAAYGSSTDRSDTVTVANSIFDGLTIGSMTYQAAKARDEENANILKLTGACSNVYHNVVREVSNGIQTGPSAAGEDSLWSYNSEVCGNTVTNTSDDAIELDTGLAINQLVMGNTTLSTLSGISTAQIIRGPCFVFYNTCGKFRSAGLKIGGTNTGIIHAFQNTFASRSTENSASGGSRAVEGVSGGTVTNLTAYNNIFYSNPAAGFGVICGPAIADSAGVSTNRFNWNLVDSVSTSPGRLFLWVEQNPNFPTWQSTYGYEANGVRAGSLFNDYDNNDFSIKRTSSAYRVGRRLTGINDSTLDGKKYSGNRPSMGSFEVRGILQ